MRLLALRERLELRRAVSQAIINGQLPQSASIVLYDPDAFSELERQVFERAQADAPQHPILAWIVSHAPQILQFVLAILPLFGVSVPPITIPGLPTPGTPSPAPTPSPADVSTADNPTDPAPIAHSAAENPTMPAALAIPPALLTLAPLLEQLAAQVAAVLLPQLEAKVEGWVKSHLPAAA